VKETQEKYVRQQSERELTALRKVAEGLQELKEAPETGYGEVVIRYEDHRIVRTKSTKERLW
jgi:hypothetical protein